MAGNIKRKKTKKSRNRRRKREETEAGKRNGARPQRTPASADGDQAERPRQQRPHQAAAGRAPRPRPRPRRRPRPRPAPAPACIRALAQKNFEELDRLSRMAGRSLQLYGGQRDLTPGFDSENITKPTVKADQPYQNYPKINIPNISKIISLKTAEAPAAAASSPATSMDEPRSAAAGAEPARREAACQADRPSWPGVEALVKAYKDFEAERARSISMLHARNTALRVSCAHAARVAARAQHRARALADQRRRHAAQERDARQQLRRLTAAIRALRDC
ncbi:uncharacterized protein [Choristoneura fumiferana]|uniref:uncharacterized protein n=1 Tax=Choristoneura fumiferana TaxID=7141 RepID=UPI003D15521C